jgi:hypothetical protein
MYLVAVAVAAICPAALAASCKPVVIGQKLQRITAVCGPGEPAVPSHCSLQCAQLFTELYGACGDAMDNIGVGMGLDGEFADFNQMCEASMTTEAVAEACSDDSDWHPTGTNTGVCQNLYETSPASQGGQGAGACDQLIAAGNTCETAFCAECDYAGYCDLACGVCEEAGCEHFAEDGLHGCECDRVSVGLDRIVAFAIPLILFIPDSLTYSVPLYLKRQCGRTLGQRHQTLQAVLQRLLQRGRHPRRRAKTDRAP